VELDHVLIAVQDLDEGARVFEDRYGLASVDGGQHRAWGTANRIVPLGTSFLELVAVVDEAAAADSVFGRWVAEAASSAGRPFGWAVRTNDLDPIADRLDLPIHSGSRLRPTGDVLSWRNAGIDESVANSSLPFFIEWGSGVRLPGMTEVVHRAAPTRVKELRLIGDPERVADWLGDHALPISVRSGPPAVSSVVLSTTTGEITIA
jgi:Glyoxalase-like domain